MIYFIGYIAYEQANSVWVIYGNTHGKEFFDIFCFFL